MRTRVALLVGAVLLAGLATAGAATATQPDAQHAAEPIDGADGNGTDVGVCMIGVDSPCNGEQWDGDDETTTNETTTNETTTNETTDSDDERIGDGEQSDDGSVGICMVGAGGPCNSDDGSDAGGQLTPVSEENRTTENRTSDRIEPDKGDGSEAGICLVGADSACNGEQLDDDNATSDDHRIGEDSRGDDAGICLVGADSACNADSGPEVSMKSITTQRQTMIGFLFGVFGVLF